MRGAAMFDWNGDGQLSPDEIALTLALLAAQQEDEEAESAEDEA